MIRKYTSWTSWNADDMKVKLQLYDEKPMSVSIPPKVTCTVAEAQVPIKGSTATPQYVYHFLDCRPKRTSTCSIHICPEPNQA